MALYKQIGDQLNEKLRQAATESLCDAMREYLKEGTQKMTEQFRDDAFDTSGYESGAGARNGYLQRDADADLAICEAATPGPWIGEHEYDDEGNELSPYWLVMQGQPMAYEFDRMEDVDFCVRAREALPYWIKRAQRAEAENQTRRDWHTKNEPHRKLRAEYDALLVPILAAQGKTETSYPDEPDFERWLANQLIAARDEIAALHAEDES